MSDERVIAYLRQRGTPTPPGDLVANVMAAVDAVPTQPSRFSPFVPALVVVGVAAAIAALALFIGPARDVGPAPSASADAIQPRSVEQLEAAVTAAVEVLRTRPGVEGVGTTHVLDEVGSVSWFSWRSNGDQVVVNRSDVDVTETGWWLDPQGGPPSRGTRISTVIQALIGDGYYFTRGNSDDAWISGLREGSPDVLGVPFPAALDGRMDPWQGTFSATLNGDASVSSLGGGGERWTLTKSVRDGVLIQAFEIGSDGALRSVSHELVGVTLSLEEPPFTSSVVELTVLHDPDPIPTPDTDAPADPAAFGMPDLPLGEADASIDYVAYVEDVLAYLEAYHWNSAEIDWAAARAAGLDGLPADPEASQAYQRIQNAIQTFDGFGTVFVRPQDVPPTEGSGAEPTDSPQSERMGNLGYVIVPSPPMSGADALADYLVAGRQVMAAVEEDAPACGWIVDLRDHAGGAWGPPVAVLGGLLGEGRALTFASGSAEWWLQVDADGVVTSAGFNNSDVLVDSPYLDMSSNVDQEISAVFAEHPAYLPQVAGAPVAVLIGNGTVTGGEQAAVAFIGRLSTRLFGGPTGASPVVAPNLRMADGAVLRVPTWAPVDRAGTRHTSGIMPDQTVGDTRATGTDAVLDAARTWLEEQSSCS
ncbi:MAG TPA: S41 family peptidase [Candidatus Limnocylindria bacterium]|nr:S41 family peptidase [Candidatus Limnocylindria bacterium]